MADRKILAGHAVRRLRRASGLTQVALADALDISPSYLNLIEKNQRPLSAALMLRLAERFDFDPRQLGGDAPGGGMEGVRRRLGDPLFADLSIDRTEIEEWLAAAPGGVEAFTRAFSRQFFMTPSEFRHSGTAFHCYRRPVLDEGALNELTAHAQSEPQLHWQPVQTLWGLQSPMRTVSRRLRGPTSVVATRWGWS